MSVLTDDVPNMT